MPFSAYFIPHASVFVVFFNSCANKTHGLGRLQWQKNNIPHNHMNLSFMRWMTLTITWPWRIVLLNSPTPARNSHFCSSHFTILLVGPWSHPRGKPMTCALVSNTAVFSSSPTIAWRANSGAVAQEKRNTRKKESPAHKYQSEIEGKAVLK